MRSGVGTVIEQGRKVGADVGGESRPRARSPRAFGGFVPRVLHDIDPLAEDSFDDLVLACEVVVERGSADADPLGDLALGDPGDTVFDDQLGGRVEDPLSGSVLVDRWVGNNRHEATLPNVR